MERRDSLLSLQYSNSTDCTVTDRTVSCCIVLWVYLTPELLTVTGSKRVSLQKLFPYNSAPATVLVKTGSELGFYYLSIL